MFDAHIQYYAYNNVDDDDFGVGYLGNKKDWVERINRWNRNDGRDETVVVEEWDDLDCKLDFRGIQLAEIEPNGDGVLVTWATKNRSYTISVAKNGDVAWVQNPNNAPSVPRWVNRMKTMLREAQKV